MASSEVSVDIHARIHAFEALSKSASPKSVTTSVSNPNLLDTPNSPTSKTFLPIAPSPPYATYRKLEKISPSPSPPILGRKTSLIDLKDWVLDDGPLQNSPPAGLLKPGPEESRPPVRPPTRHVSDSSWRLHSSSTPLINLQIDTGSSSKPKAPPLPPRKTSSNSLRSVSVSNSSSSSLARSPIALSIPLPSSNRKKSDSLTVDPPYPPLLGTSTPRAGHASGSSISSFHSVSLSSDAGTDCTTPGSISNFVATYPIDREDLPENNVGDKGSPQERDDLSLDESYENVSVSAISPSASSLIHDWGEYTKRREPPKLPQRPKPSSEKTPSPTNPRPVPASPHVSPTLKSKQPPPPPPSRTRPPPPPPSNRSSLASTINSDRSSILSAATSRTSLSSTRPPIPAKPPQALLKLSRPTPIPPAARRRYEAVFNGNVIARRRAEAQERAKSPPPGRKARQAAGWRGLSVDLITNPEPDHGNVNTGVAVDEEVGPDDVLDGRTVAMIWKASKLEQAKLREIWDEVDPEHLGCLRQGAFVQGMWRIDEELRKARLKPKPTLRLRQSSTRPPSLI